MIIYHVLRCNKSLKIRSIIITDALGRVNKPRPIDRISSVTAKEMKMFRYKERPANTELYARIKLVPMTAIERQVAINALNDAEAIVDGIVWIKNAMKDRKSVV